MATKMQQQQQWRGNGVNGEEEEEGVPVQMAQKHSSALPVPKRKSMERRASLLRVLSMVDDNNANVSAPQNSYDAHNDDSGSGTATANASRSLPRPMPYFGSAAGSSVSGSSLGRGSLLGASIGAHSLSSHSLTGGMLTAGRSPGGGERRTKQNYNLIYQIPIKSSDTL